MSNCTAGSSVRRERGIHRLRPLLLAAVACAAVTSGAASASAATNEPALSSRAVTAVPTDGSIVVAARLGKVVRAGAAAGTSASRAANPASGREREQHDSEEATDSVAAHATAPARKEAAPALPSTPTVAPAPTAAAPPVSQPAAAAIACVAGCASGVAMPRASATIQPAGTSAQAPVESRFECFAGCNEGAPRIASAPAVRDQSAMQATGATQPPGRITVMRGVVRSKIYGVPN